MSLTDELLAFPTVVFTFTLGLSVLYWLFVIVGAVAVDALDFDVDALLDGATEGAVDAATGAVDGASHGLLWHIANALALRQAPLTVVVSVFSLWAFLASYMLSHFVAPMLTFLPAWLTGSSILLLALALATPLTATVVRPLGRLFETRGAETRLHSLGRMCEIRTGRVTADFGQAEIVDGGAGLLVEVRCEAPNELQRGSKALVVDFDSDREVYWIEPMAHLDVQAHEAGAIGSNRDTLAAEIDALEHAAVEHVEVAAEETTPRSR